MPNGRLCRSITFGAGGLSLPCSLLFGAIGFALKTAPFFSKRDMNLDSGVDTWYQSGANRVYPNRWAAAIQACQRYYHRNIWMMEGFNEPITRPITKVHLRTSMTFLVTCRLPRISQALLWRVEAH